MESQRADATGTTRALEIEDTKDASKIEATAAHGDVSNSKASAIIVTVALGFQVLVEAVGLGAMDELDSVSSATFGLLINSITISLALGSALTRARFVRR